MDGWDEAWNGDEDGDEKDLQIRHEVVLKKDAEYQDLPDMAMRTVRLESKETPGRPRRTSTPEKHQESKHQSLYRENKTPDPQTPPLVNCQHRASNIELTPNEHFPSTLPRRPEVMRTR